MLFMRAHLEVARSHVVCLSTEGLLVVFDAVLAQDEAWLIGAKDVA
jgi:hypothetical protein